MHRHPMSRPVLALTALLAIVGCDVEIENRATTLPGGTPDERFDACLDVCEADEELCDEACGEIAVGEIVIVAPAQTVTPAEPPTSASDELVVDPEEQGYTPGTAEWHQYCALLTVWFPSVSPAVIDPSCLDAWVPVQGCHAGSAYGIALRHNTYYVVSCELADVDGSYY